MQAKAHIFVNGTACISPQNTFDGALPEEVIRYSNNVLTCRTPDFKAYLPPTQLRRLSRMLRIGLTASVMCMRNAGVQSPDGIITATGYGFLEDTEKFLREIIERNEQQLTPTFFMQGTYNALAGLAGLALRCTGYNNTYVSKGFALGSALQDAAAQIRRQPELNFLVGAYDEAAAVQYKSAAREGHFKKEFIDSDRLYEHATPGSLQGEGAAFFLLSGVRTAQTLCRIKGIHGLFLPSSEDLPVALTEFLDHHGVTTRTLDLWIAGFSGDVDRDRPLSMLDKNVLSAVPQARFKHLTGEFCTADGFAVWLAARIIKDQHIPQVVRIGTNNPPAVEGTAADSAGSTTYSRPRRIEKVLVVNHYLNRNYVFYLLERLIR